MPEPERAVASQAQPRRPASVTHYGLNSIALGIVLVTMYVIRTQHRVVRDEVLLLCGAVAIPVVLMDVLFLRVHRRESTGIDWDKPFEPDARRVLFKLVGLLAVLAPFALAYWAFPEYQGSFYAPLWGLMRRFAAVLLVGVPLYMTMVDGRMREPKDAYWQLGRALLGHRADARRFDIANLYRGWLVKAFFFPLMFVWLNNSTHNVVNFDLSTASWSNLRAYDFLYDFIFFVDLLFTTVGYALSLRPIDAHIRTAEPTMLGWAVALFCYQPFYSLMERQYVHYDTNSFGSWLEPYPNLRWAWAIVVLFLITIYVLATVAFGVRFSNLTHRGILTNGPYRFTKHPAYISKNLSWWMVSVPFLMNDGWPSAIRHSLLLGVINFMYFMRARTEERHLGRDATYVAYATWMNEHGALRFLNRVPGIRYTPPVEAAPAPLPVAAE